MFVLQVEGVFYVNEPLEKLMFVLWFNMKCWIMFVLQVEGVFYVNEPLEKLMFEELRNASRGGGEVTAHFSFDFYSIIYTRGHQTRSWRACVLQSLAPTCLNTPAWKFEVYQVRPWLAASGVFD